MLPVLAFTAEDRPLIERIYLSKSPALRKLAYRYLKDEQAAADVVQQSALDFMEIFHTLTYVSESKLCGYLYGNTAQKSRRDTARSDIIRPWINR